MKAQFLKIAGVKSEREFYQRFPTEESFFKAFPEALKTAQMGTNIPGIVDGMGMGMSGIESTGNMFEELTPINNPFSTQSIINTMANKLPVNTSSIPSIGNDVSGLDKVGSQLPGLAGSVIKGISQIKAQKQQLKKAKQTNQLSGIYKTLSGIREKQPERRYVRPEDSLINPDQLYPSTGVGTNVLAKNGKNIDSYQFGGELTNLFSQEGLENIASSGIVDKGMSALFPDMADSGGATIGGAIGEAAGNFIPIPVVGPMIGKTVGKLLGSAFDKTGKKIKKEQKQTQDNLSTMMINNGATGMHQANYSYMEDGGLIPLMEEGGELQTHWGGHAETVSQNPYLEDGGETIMFRGNSHEESDNNGNTGIGITYGNSPVEVERGEPATKINDELVVYGNLSTDKFQDLLGKEAKNKKFKTLVSDWTKDEEKQNKFLEKSITQLDELNPLDPFDKLKFNALRANVLGANTKLKDIAEKKKIAANLQEAINTTAEEYGVEADALSKGKLKPISNSNMNIAKDGITKKKNNSNEGDVHQKLNELTQILANKGIDFKISSGYIKGAKTSTGRDSQHGKGGALDITFPKLGKEAYNKMINDPDIAKFVYDNGLTIIDEYDPNNLSQTKGSGGHLHFGFDKGTKLSDKFRKEYISKYPSTTTPETTNPEFLIKGNQKGAIDYNDRNTTSNDIWKGDNYKNQWIPKVNKAINDPKIADKLISQIENYSGQDADDVKYQLSKAKSKEDKLKIINSLATDELLGPFHKLVNDSIDIASSPEHLNSGEVTQLPEMVIPNKKPAIKKEEPKKSNLLDVISSVVPNIRPSDAESLDHNQLLGEMYALGTNQLEPVQAQTYQPQLRTPYDISRQAAKNDLTAQTRAAQRMAQGNPAAQAMIAAQAYSLMQHLNEQDFIDNQKMKDSVYSGNIATLNDANLKNLAIYDQQYDRQASAKANTKATTQAALNSISSKYLQNDAANRKLQIYENLYGYRFDDQGRAVNQNGPVVYNSPQITDGQDIPIYDNDGNIVGYKRAGKRQTIDSVRTLPINPEKTTNTKSKAKNGKNLNSSIVKAMKNL